MESEKRRQAGIVSALIVILLGSLVFVKNILIIISDIIHPFRNIVIGANSDNEYLRNFEVVNYGF